MENPILNFLKEKSQRLDGDNSDKYYNYPMTISDENNKVVVAFIQDAHVIIKGDEFTLKIIVLAQYPEVERALHITKTCIAPVGCVVDWDSLHCSYSLDELSVDPYVKDESII